jgi:hypothetical protein
MENPTPAQLFAQRWHALLVANTVIQNEHLELVSSFTKPFSAKQKMQLNANAVRLQNLSLELHTLVDEWSADARAGGSQPHYKQSERNSF